MLTPDRLSLRSAALMLAVATLACGDKSRQEPDDVAEDIDDTADDSADSSDPDGVDSADGADLEDVADDLDDDGSGSELVDDEPDDGAEPDADARCRPDWLVVDRTAEGSGAGTDGLDPATALPDGRSRAGRVRNGGGDFVGPYAHCRDGDWILENSHLRVCVADARSMTPMLFDGGNIVDIEWRATPGNDELYYLVPASGLLNQAADAVELVDDGSGGGPAVVRVTGPDVLAMFLAATIGGELIAPVELNFVTEYRLGADATALEVVTWVERAVDTLSAILVGDLMGGGDTTLSWAEGAGFTPPSALSPTSLFVSVGQAHSVGVWSEELRTADVFLPEVKIPFGGLYHTSGVLCPEQTAAYRRYVTVGDGDTFSVRDRLGGIMPARVGESVTFVSEEGAARAFEIRSADGQSVDVLRLDGLAEVTLPAGAYVATPLDWPTDDVPERAFTVPASDAISLPAPALGTVDISVVAMLEPGGDRVASNAEVEFFGPVQVRVVVLDGAETLALPPGEYDVRAANGMEFSLWTGTVVIEAGESAALAVALDRELDTVGWVSGDLHQHATPSPDSLVSLRDRVLSNVGAGVDFIAPSDHDAVGDFAGAIADLGLSDRLHLLLGEELSPGVGHINLFPRRYDRNAAFAGAIPLGTRVPGSRSLTLPNTAAYIETARADGVTLVQINHPRGPLSLFGSVRYDPVAGPDANTDPNWLDDFDAIEVYNLRNRFCTGLQDWFSLLNHGRIVTGLGNSDTHNLEVRAGWPRNYVRAGTDAAAELTDEALITAINAGHVSVSGGILVEFVGGLFPGDTLDTTAGEEVQLTLRLQAPSWIDVDELVVFVDGRETQRLPIDRGELGEAFDTTVDVPITVDRDGYVVFIAHSTDIVEAVSGRWRAFGFTNPVFFDVGGDGWTPPGVASPEDLPVPSGLPNCG